MRKAYSWKRLVTRLFNRIRRAEVAAVLPALALAGLWFGGHGLGIVALTCLPLLLLQPGGPGRQVPQPRGPRDGLTDLCLRDEAVAAIDAMLDSAVHHRRGLICLVIGLDDPQGLVARLGQSTHDRAVRQLALRARAALRDGDLLGRLEGARVVVALVPSRRADLEGALQVAARLRAAIEAPMPIDGITLFVSVSIGFCLSDQLAGADGGDLLAAAELAMEETWRHGPAGLRAYGHEIAQASTSRAALRDTIGEALDRGEVHAHFQPQVSTDTGRITGFEALARWRHPERGLLAPAEFLPLVSGAGLSARLGEVMLRSALSSLRAWDRAGFGIATVAVNFSKEELRDPTLVDRIRWELDRFELTPARLSVEILESVVADSDGDVICRNIRALSQLGCGIDLDDFGTGHASIAAIRRFVVKRLKIDRTFVSGIDTDASQKRLVAAILALAERLGIDTLAEGVETAGEHAMLAQLGCGHVQGFGIGRPMPFEETAGWIAAHQAKIANMPRLGRRAF